MGDDIILLIPHYGELHYLKNCLASLQDLLDKPDQILIFNNTAFLNSELNDGANPNIEVIGADGTNVGFTAAINQLICCAGPTYYWILNNDAVVHPEALRSLVQTMRDHHRCGIVSSYIYDAEHRENLCFTGGGEVTLGRHRTDRSEKPRKERWVTFCSVLIRAEMIQQIGLLDPNYFLVCSDSDLCYTARARGWDILSDPGSTVYHHEEHGISRIQNTDPDMDLRKKMVSDQRYFQEKWVGSELFRDLNLEIFPGE